MDFALSEEQQELAGLAARILEDRMTLPHLKERDRSDDWYDLDTWREFAKANLLGIALPETVGGLGFGFLDLCMVLREVGRLLGFGGGQQVERASVGPVNPMAHASLRKFQP